jgi:hypothetical protein
MTNLACSKVDISTTLVHSSYIISYLALLWYIHVGLPLEGHPCSSMEVNFYFAFDWVLFIYKLQTYKTFQPFGSRI